MIPRDMHIFGPVPESTCGAGVPPAGLLVAATDGKPPARRRRHEDVVNRGGHHASRPKNTAHM